MLIWGSGGDSKDLGIVETRRCDTCEKDRPFKLFLQYRYSHIWYLFSWISQKKYLLLCDICQRGVELDAKRVEPKLKSNPIPFRKRYGWTFLVALIAIGWGFITLENQAQEANDYSYINDPRVNDLYVVDVSKLLVNPEQSPMYGVMRIKAVGGDRVEFFMSKVGYTRISGANKDIRNGQAYGNDYYAADTLLFRISELKAMRDNRNIKTVRRN